MSVNLEEFKKRAETASLVPVWKDCLLDTDTPVSAFAKLRRGPFAFLLESAPAGGETWSRYTFLGTEPRSREARQRCSRRLDRRGGWHNARHRPIHTDLLADRVGETRVVPELGISGGAVGYSATTSWVSSATQSAWEVRTTTDALFVFTRRSSSSTTFTRAREW